MRQKGFVHILLLVVILFISIGAVVYLAFQNSLSKKQGEPTTTPQIETNNSAKNEAAFYKYAYEVMGITSNYQDVFSMNQLKPVDNYSDIDNWKTYTNDCLGYELKHPSELTGGGSLFLRRNTKSFTPRISVVDTQPWNIFKDNELDVQSEESKTITLDNKSVRYSKFMGYKDNILKNYFIVYQYPVENEFLHFVFNFINQDDELCSSFLDLNVNNNKAPKDYHPENIICKDDMSLFSKEDYNDSYKVEVELFNSMAKTIKTFPKKECLPVFSEGL